MKPNSYKEVYDYQSSDVMGQPLGKGERAKKTFADLTQSLDVSVSPFQLPSPLVFPLLAHPEVGKLSAASPSLPITLSPCRGSHLLRLVPGSRFVSVGVRVPNGTESRSEEDFLPTIYLASWPCLLLSRPYCFLH